MLGNTLFRVTCRLVKEPLIHFTAVGLLTFMVFSVSAKSETDQATEIVISRDDISRMERTWVAQWGRAPTDTELENLITTEIREEVLYRQALAFGLDKDDVIVRRRLAQKMEFLAEDIVEGVNANELELKQFFLDNRDRYIAPASISFEHIYFNPDHRKDASADARRLLSRAIEEGVLLASGEGDQFIGPAQFALRTPKEISNLFGRAFADQIFAVEKGTGAATWKGPVRSGLGFHLVSIDSLQNERHLSFEEARQAVESDWLESRHADLFEQAIEKMQENYRIKVERNANETAQKS